MISIIVEHPFLVGYPLLSLCIGVVLCFFLLAEEQWRVEEPEEFMLLLFFPAIGWGFWKYGQRQRLKARSIFPRKELVYARMGTLHAIMLTTALLIIFGYVSIELNGLKQDNIGDASSGTAKMELVDAGLEAIGDLLFGTGLLLFSGIVFASYVFLFVISAVIPWVIAGRIRSSHYSARIHELESQERARGA